MQQALDQPVISMKDLHNTYIGINTADNGDRMGPWDSLQCFYEDRRDDESELGVVIDAAFGKVLCCMTCSWSFVREVAQPFQSCRA